jgi:PAS domain S-box-containing protein
MMAGMHNTDGFNLKTENQTLGAEWLALAFSRIGDAVVASDEEGIVSFMNPKAEELTGWTTSEAVGQSLDTVLQVVVEPNGQGVEGPTARRITHDAQAGWENSRYLVSKQGTKTGIEQTAIPMRDDNGENSGVLFIVRELPQGQPALSQIEESERRFRQIVAVLPAALYTTDAEGQINLFNEAAVQLWGRRPEPGDRWCGSWKIYWPDGSPVPLEDCPMGIALKSGRSVHGKEIIVERPDGSRKNVLPYPEPLFDSQGRIAGAVNMLVDITHRKHMEQSLEFLATPSTGANASPTQDQASGRRIVVVDDNVGAATLLSRLLGMLGGHKVQMAHEGNAALELIESSHPEVVLLDIGLPGKNGYQVAEALRKRSEFDDMLLVALTGYGQQEDLQRSKEAGFDLHYVKPPSVDQMKEILRHPKLKLRQEPPRQQPASQTEASKGFGEGGPIGLAQGMDIPKLRHDLNNVAFVLSLVEEMFANHDGDANLIQQAGAALSKEVHRINRMVESLRWPREENGAS